MIYYARSANDCGEKETVEHHLRRSGELCEQFLNEIGYSDYGKLLGNVHDFGKISLPFQQVLEGKKTGVNHALPGATFLLAVYGTKKKSVRMLAAVVASHHGELKCYGDYESEILRSYSGEGNRWDKDNREYSLFGKTEYQKAFSEWKKDFPLLKSFQNLPVFRKDEDPNLSEMMFERMLFSALVDADWSSSAEHFDPDYLKKHTGAELEAKEAMERLLNIRAIKQKNSTASPLLNCMRDQLFDACLVAGEQNPGLFTLTAPTGLGKTLSLLAFAVKHCEKWKKRRIILVLPYLTIIEQNCKDYREVISDILEIHSNVVWTDDTRALAERWDAPCIVTTNVGFFEPLFSAQPGSCRHLHQLADSVIVLDEAQSLPAHLLDATLRTVKLLCDSYGCTVVFSTATQPSFQYRKGLVWNPREITPDPSALFRATRRVSWEWRTNGRISLSDLADEMADYTQCCVIVNLKRHARDLLEKLRSRYKEEDIFYLSTDLCSSHRTCTLDQVRDRLKNGQPCLLVATQCIEAGVDLDFPVVYRSLAPLEALIQAAGRCNRNGDRPDGKMIVFIPEDEKNIYPTEEYGRAAMCVLTLLSRHEIDCNDLSHIEEYYQLLYENASGDSRPLVNAIQCQNFVETERQYQMIGYTGLQVIVPYEDEKDLYEKIRDELDGQGLTTEIIRKASPITVSCYDAEKVKRYCTALHHRSREMNEEAATGYYLLGIEQYYDEKQGLNFNEMFDGIF